jgi:hypothetical protein
MTYIGSKATVSKRANASTHLGGSGTRALISVCCEVDGGSWYFVALGEGGGHLQLGHGRGGSAELKMHRL